jgi:hypothetical protein
MAIPYRTGAATGTGAVPPIPPAPSRQPVDFFFFLKLPPVELNEMDRHGLSGGGHVQDGMLGPRATQAPSKASRSNGTSITQAAQPKCRCLAQFSRSDLTHPSLGQSGHPPLRPAPAPTNSSRPGPPKPSFLLPFPAVIFRPIRPSSNRTHLDYKQKIHNS